MGPVGKVGERAFTRRFAAWIRRNLEPSAPKLNNALRRLPEIECIPIRTVFLSKSVSLVSLLFCAFLAQHDRSTIRVLCHLVSRG